MDSKLHLLESFIAHGSDGADYKVCGYEHMVRDISVPERPDRWESSGIAEYRLADGARVDVDATGSMRVAATGVELRRD